MVTDFWNKLSKINVDFRSEPNYLRIRWTNFDNLCTIQLRYVYPQITKAQVACNVSFDVKSEKVLKVTALCKSGNSNDVWCTFFKVI